MPEHEPHRSNYAELNKAHEEAQQQQATPEPLRPETIRSAGRTEGGGMASQQEEAIRRNNDINREWKLAMRNPEQAQKMQQELEQERASQRENEDPQRDHPGGRER